MTKTTQETADNQATPTDTDWRALASTRLDRLAELEHDHSETMERLTALQTEHRHLLHQLGQEHNLQRQVDELNQSVSNLFQELQDVRHSWSWRITRPLRVANVFKNHS